MTPKTPEQIMQSLCLSGKLIPPSMRGMVARMDDKIGQYKAMLQKIDELVNTDFMCDMQIKYLEAESGRAEYTHEEAMKMASIIFSVYEISHQITCTAHP